MTDKPRIIVVGGGLAGLAAVIKIAEAGHDCDLAIQSLFHATTFELPPTYFAGAGFNVCTTSERPFATLTMKLSRSRSPFSS